MFSSRRPQELNTMWIRFTAEYIAGISTGAGAAIFFIALAAQSDLLSSEFLTGSGALFAGLALILGGGGMKWRAQSAKHENTG